MNERIPAEKLTLQQRAMSFLSILNNHQAYSREDLQRLIREMLDAGWNNPTTERQLWMAWTDRDDGWIAAIHGSDEFREHIKERIARDTEEHGCNRFDVRPVRVTVHLEKGK